tara:strand:+ start:5330 stop:5791 length:462 start_codon:yes stop_codon:yes gene_type:complete
MKQNNIDNPDRAAIAAFIDGGLQNGQIDSSPLLKALKCQILDASTQYIRLRFEPGIAHVQGNGVICGGIVATMLDFALAFAALTTCARGESAISVGLNVNYIGPVFIGPTVVEAGLVSNKFRFAQAEAKLCNLEGVVLATATSPLAMKRYGKA